MRNPKDIAEAIEGYVKGGLLRLTWLEADPYLTRAESRGRSKIAREVADQILALIPGIEEAKKQERERWFDWLETNYPDCVFRIKASMPKSQWQALKGGN